jgi:HlyD family secretion protein
VRHEPNVVTVRNERVGQQMRAQAPTGGNMSKKARRIIIPVVVLVIVAAIVVVGLKVLRAKKTASVSAGKTGVSSMYVVAKKDVATLTTVSGTIHPVRYATLTAQAAGTFTAVYKKEGDAVKAGEVIALIDSAAHDIQLAQAESSYRQSLISFETADTTDLAATKTQLETAVKQAEIQQLSAENNLKSAIDDDTNAQTVANLEEQVTKAGENLATAQSNLKYLQDHDTSEQQLMLSDASVRQAELSLNTAQTRLATLLAQDVTEEQLAALEAQVRQAKSSLLSAQLSLDEAAQSSTTSDARLTLMQDQVDEAQISLETAESNLKNASADNKASQTDIDAQKAAVESAKTGLENAEASYKSTEASLDQRKLNLDAAQLQVNQAERAVTDAKNNLAANQKTIDATASNVELLKANVDQAKAAVALAQSNLAGYSDTVRKAALQADALKEQKKQTELSIEATRLESENYVVKAPYDCVITALSVKVGDEASSGTTVAVVADTTVWNISAYVDEVDVLSVKTGQDASVTMDAYSNQTFTGKVTYVGHALTTTSTSVSAYPVTVQVTKPPQTIVDGMSADASIAIAVAKGALAVPIEAVLTENGKTYVTLVSVGADKTTTMTKTEVKTGIEGDEYVEIKSGLKAGDRVLRTVSTTATTTTSTTTTTETQPGGLDIPGGIVPGGTGGPGGPGGPGGN